MTNQGLKIVRRVVQSLMIDKVIITKVARIVSVMFLRKIKKPISMFEVFSLVFFLCFCVRFFFISFVIVSIIRTRKLLSTHFNMRQMKIKL